MKICCCTIAMRDEPLESQLPKLSAAGYDGVEVWFKHVDGRSDGELDALRDQARKLKLDIEVVAPYWWLTQTAELLEETYQIAGRAIRAARRLGAPKIRTFTDSGPTGIGSDRATPDHWRTAILALRRVCGSAPDLRFVVETHEQTLADTPESTERLMREAALPNLRVNFQPSRVFDLASYRRLRPWIEHMHVHNSTAEGKGTWLDAGVYDMGSLIAAIARDGYSHSLSVEYCFKGATWERIAAARAFVAKYVAIGRRSASAAPIAPP